MSARATRNNRIAGLFVILALIGALVLLTLVGGGLERIGKKTVLAEFTVEDGAASLQPGSVVTLGGLKIGTVTSVKHGDSYGSILVKLSVDSGVPLRDGATPILVPPILGGSGVVNFKSLGDEDGLPIAKDTVLVGESGGNPILGDFSIDDILGDYNIYSMFDTTKESPDGVLGEIEGLVRDARGTVDGAQYFFREAGDASFNLNTVIGPGIATVVDDTESTLASIDQVFTDLSVLTGEAASQGTNFGETLAVAFDEDKGIRSILANADQVTTRVNTLITDQRVKEIGASVDAVKVFLDRLTIEGNDLNTDVLAIVSELKSASSLAQQTLASVSYNTDDLIADLSLTAIQLRDTSLELRRSPWRLLYRPTADQLNFETLYDAARMYAGAVTDLRSSTGLLRSALETETDGVTAEQGARLISLIENAELATERYTQAEQAFIKLLEESVQD